MLTCTLCGRSGENLDPEFPEFREVWGDSVCEPCLVSLVLRVQTALQQLEARKRELERKLKPH